MTHSTTHLYISKISTNQFNMNRSIMFWYPLMKYYAQTNYSLFWIKYLSRSVSRASNEIPMEFITMKTNNTIMCSLTFWGFCHGIQYNKDWWASYRYISPLLSHTNISGNESYSRFNIADKYSISFNYVSKHRDTNILILASIRFLNIIFSQWNGNDKLPKRCGHFLMAHWNGWKSFGFSNDNNQLEHICIKDRFFLCLLNHLFMTYSFVCEKKTAINE